MKTVNMSPLPWSAASNVERPEHALRINDANGARIAATFFLQPDKGETAQQVTDRWHRAHGNARFMVRAANAYPKLLIALKQQVEHGRAAIKSGRWPADDAEHAANEALLRELGE